MYFDFEDYRPDITPVGRAISWREGVLLSIIVHLVMVILLLLAPQWFPFDSNAARARARAAAQQQPQEPTPVRVRAAARRSAGAEAAAARRAVRSGSPGAHRASAPKPTNPLPFSRGNTPRAGRAAASAEAARGRGPEPDPPPAAGAAERASPTRTAPIPESPSALQLPTDRRPPLPPNGAGGRAPAGGGSLGDALRNLQRYVQTDQFDNRAGRAARSARRFSSTPRASSSGRGSAGSSRR